MIWLFLVTLAIWSGIFLLINSKISFQSPELDSKIIEQELTIVIAARNEAENLSKLLHSISSQSWLPDQIRINIVDDASEDKTIEVAKSLAREFNFLNINVEELKQGQGKKAALRQGLSGVKSGLIYLTDADVVLQPDVLKGLANILNDDKASAVFGAVVIEGHNILSRLSSIENLNNQCVTEAFINMNRPVMANGANLMFKADVLEVYLDSLESQTVSGDDVFFVHKLESVSVLSLFHQYMAVVSKPSKSFSEFYHQRIRWAAKSTEFKSLMAKGFGVLILFINLGFIGMLISPIFYHSLGWVLIFFCFKWIMEYTFHSYWFRKYNVKHRMLDALILTIIYPFYSVLIASLSISGVGYIWKDRRYVR